MRTKTWSYATGAFFGGVAGAFFASFKSATFPDDFFFNISVFILCMVILGGIGNIPGVIFGACFLAYLNQEGLVEHRRLAQRPLRAGRHAVESGTSRRRAVQLRDLRGDPRRRDAASTRGPDTEPRAARRSSARACTTSRCTTWPGPAADGAARGHAAAQGVRRARRGRRRRLQRSRSARSSSLIGPNGAGKTTFFNMLTGVYKPTAGRIVFDGEDVTGKPPHAFTERGIGRTFQNIRLFQNMTALENVLVGMHSRLKGNVFDGDAADAAACGARRSGARERGARAARVLRPAAGRATSSRRTSPTATSGGSRSRARSRPSRSCCSSTSRRPA